jgi:hypothetical protein
MKLPSIKRITIEDLGQKAKKDEPALIKAIGFINTYIEQVYNALNKGLTIGDNFDGIVLDVTLDGVYPYRIRWERKTPPKAVWVVYSDTLPGAAVFCHWSFTADGQLSIDDVLGVAPTIAAKVNIRLICLVG